ncbi:hypothetical protein [Pararhizobium sp.]|uniref:hypothetical protein n=1 Tax=Pararhizobium sp. TaxID=1977563 RepID=UPI003D0B7EF6
MATDDPQLPNPPQAKEARRLRSAGIRQSDIARAIKGAMQGGMDVREVFATPHGIRIFSNSAPVLSKSNDWDEVLNDG